MKRPLLTMGPLLFHWPADKKRDFWFRVADECPVEIVYLGETVCSKRIPFFDFDQLEVVAGRLRRAGKTVVWSSLAEVVTKQDRLAVESLCSTGRDMVEVNDISALWHLGGRGHHIGQGVNVYNADTLAFLAVRGAKHFCLPIELPLDAIDALAARADELGVGVEVQVFGRMPLAISARCYHARAHGRAKDACLMVCEEDPDGMELRTLSNIPFLTINGVQTLSYRYVNLADDIPNLVRSGVTAFRVAPHSHDMVSIATQYRALLDGKATADEVRSELVSLGVPEPLANGFLHRRPGAEARDEADVNRITQ